MSTFNMVVTFKINGMSSLDVAATLQTRVLSEPSFSTPKQPSVTLSREPTDGIGSFLCTVTISNFVAANAFAAAGFVYNKISGGFAPGNDPAATFLRSFTIAQTS